MSSFALFYTAFLANTSACLSWCGDGEVSRSHSLFHRDPRVRMLPGSLLGRLAGGDMRSRCAALPKTLIPLALYCATKPHFLNDNQPDAKQGKHHKLLCSNCNHCHTWRLKARVSGGECIHYVSILWVDDMAGCGNQDDRGIGTPPIPPRHRRNLDWWSPALPGLWPQGSLNSGVGICLSQSQVTQVAIGSLV